MAKLPSPEEGAEAAAACTMVMEALVVLVDPSVCLDPLAPAEQAQSEDTPGVAQVRGRGGGGPGEGLGCLGEGLPAGVAARGVGR